jgi:hypothetical protein
MEAEGEITTARPFMEAKDLRAGVIQYKPPVKKPDEDWNQYIDRNVAEYDMICGQAVAERVSIARRNREPLKLTFQISCSLCI